MQEEDWSSIIIRWKTSLSMRRLHPRLLLFAPDRKPENKNKQKPPSKTIFTHHPPYLSLIFYMMTNALFWPTNVGVITPLTQSTLSKIMSSMHTEESLLKGARISFREPPKSCCLSLIRNINRLGARTSQPQMTVSGKPN